MASVSVHIYIGMYNVRRLSYAWLAGLLAIGDDTPNRDGTSRKDLIASSFSLIPLWLRLRLLFSLPLFSSFRFSPFFFLIFCRRYRLRKCLMSTVGGSFLDSRINTYVWLAFCNFHSMILNNISQAFCDLHLVYFLIIDHQIAKIFINLRLWLAFCDFHSVILNNISQAFCDLHLVYFLIIDHQIAKIFINFLKIQCT